MVFRKRPLPDFFFSTGLTALGFLVLNLVLQAFTYPRWTECLGNERAGDVLYLLALTDIAAVTLGTACSYARMKESVAEDPGSGSYLVLQLLSSLLLLPLCFLFTLNRPEHEPSVLILYMLVTLLRMFRYWGMVSYHLRRDYRGLFVYHLLISLGFLLGAWLFEKTGLWPLSLLPGEAMALACRGYLWLRKREFFGHVRPSLILSALSLALSYLLSNVFYNADKLILMTFLGGESVTFFQLSAWGGRVMSLLSTAVDAVLIGYLVKKSGRLDMKLMRHISMLALAAFVLLGLVSTLGSMLWIRLRYAYNYDQVRSYFLLSNLAYVLYFITEVFTVVLLRYGRTRLQLLVNLVFLLGFVLCSLMTHFLQLQGFVLSFFLLNLIRCLLALALGFREARRDTKEGMA